MAAGSQTSPDEEFVLAWRQLFAQKREAIITELFANISKEIGELADDPRLAGLLEASVSENIVSAINFLEGGTSVDDLDATSAALAHARMLAQRDIPLSSLFRAYHLGHAMFVRLGIEVIAELDPAHHLPLTQRLLGRSVVFIDKVCEQVGRAYEAERDQWVGDRGGIRQHWVAEVLSGRTVDLSEAEAALGYRFAGTHVGVQMWLPARLDGVDARGAFEETRRQLAKVLSPIAPPLMLPRDEREMHAWFPIRTDSMPVGDELSSTLEKTPGLKVQLAIGRPEPGIEGFRRTSDQAKRVKDILLVSAKKLPMAVTYEQLGPVALMTADVDALRRFVRRVLGSLAKNGEREETLRDTLLTFLAHNRSYAATAQAMVLHRNSVQYRVQRALELCERDLNDPDVALGVHTALTAAHWLGRAVLERG
ncbi:MAG TPA: helix-turn-helix domain-containing protein [Aeromicrobium sp.]|nr:helix-turn-helix domain-containing protein [Aeromicrobium sp.]